MATMLAYGFFGDIIQQSDNWRCLGPLRYDLAGFCQFVRNTSYHSELTITLSPHSSAQICHPQSINNGNTTSSVAPDYQQFMKTESSEMQLRNLLYQLRHFVVDIVKNVLKKKNSIPEEFIYHYKSNVREDIQL